MGKRRDRILGISSFHQLSACLVEGGSVIRTALGRTLPTSSRDPLTSAGAVRDCLVKLGDFGSLDGVAVHAGPTFGSHRSPEAPKGLSRDDAERGYACSLGVRLGQRTKIEPLVRQLLEEAGVHDVGPFFYPEHHPVRAASAFFISSFVEAGVLIVNHPRCSLGQTDPECDLSTIGAGRGSALELGEQLAFPHGLGVFYSVVEAFLGICTLDELVRMADSGKPRYVETLLENLLEFQPDGSFRFCERYFRPGRKPYHVFAALVGEPRERGDFRQSHRDLARSVLAVTEEVILRMAYNVRRRYDVSRLCLAGDLAMMPSLRDGLTQPGLFEEVSIPDVESPWRDAIGAALYMYNAKSAVSARPTLRDAS